MDDWAAAISAANTAIDTAKWAAEYVQTGQLQEKQNQFNLDMWNLQNEYNSPQAQMQRFQEAGLNPNLMYSQGTAGNNASAPAKNVPDYSRSWDRLSRTFNLVGLMNAIAEMKKNKEEARIIELSRKDKEDEREALHSIGQLYSYDMNTGRYVWHYNPVEVSREVKNYRPGDGSTRSARVLHEVTRNLRDTYLLDPKYQSLMASANLFPYRSALLEAQKNYLVPQTTIANYEAAHIPWSFWIGQGAKAIGAATNLVGAFNPKNWILNLGRRGGAYRAPGGKIYYY